MSSRQPQRQRQLTEEEFREHQATERERARLAEEAERERARLAEAMRRQREQEAAEQRQKAAKEALNIDFNRMLTEMGYDRPPKPPPYLESRALKKVIREVQSRKSDVDFSKALDAYKHEIEEKDDYKLSIAYFGRLKDKLTKPSSFLRKAMRLLSPVHESTERATISIDIPEVEQALQKKMLGIEQFLAGAWENLAGEWEKKSESSRGVLAIYVDQASQSTILQIGIAKHGPIYITIPGILNPEALANKSIRELLNRIVEFCEDVDPMAVINGSHQGINYNEIFLKAHVVRAPSGDTLRLQQNLQETRRRERLSAENTVVLNSAPSTEDEYRRVFREDSKARHWRAWGNESRLWNQTATSTGFAPSAEASRAALVAALSQAKNVIVIVAHCDGKSLFMPDGTIVTAEDLLKHKDQISANGPFVYLFSCEAGSLTNLRNFASTLLECGAVGVVASQSTLGSAEGQTMLRRLLDERRGTPPIDDFFDAMIEVKFREMEVFLA